MNVTCSISFRLLIVLPPHDEAGGILLEVTSLDAHAALAPRGTRSIAADRAFAFAAAVRVVIRVHRRAANGRTDVVPAGLARFSFINEVEVLIANDSDGRPAVIEELPDLGGSKTDHDVLAFRTQHLSGGSGRAAHLAAFARLELNVVDEGSFGDGFEFAAVAGFDIGRFVGDDDVPYF